MAIKTYTAAQALADIDRDEWVPADVARELFEALNNIKNCKESDLTMFCISVDSIACAALAKACES